MRWVQAKIPGPGKLPERVDRAAGCRPSINDLGSAAFRLLIQVVLKGDAFVVVNTKGFGIIGEETKGFRSCFDQFTRNLIAGVDLFHIKALLH